MRRSAQPRVALIVDHPQRDLAGLVLTAFELCQRGITCHLVPLNLQHGETYALAPDLVMLNYLRRANGPFAETLRDAGIAFGVLDTEGVVWSGFESYTELLWTDAAMLHAADPVCLWGPRLGEHLVASGAFDVGQVRVTGVPRFDFYHPAWAPVLAGDAASADARPRVLVNTGYSFANPRFTTRAGNAATFRDEYGWPAERIEAAMAAESAGMEAMLALAAQLAADLPACTVVVRPHPHEDPRPYVDRLGALPNVELNLSGPVQPQLARAAVLVQRNCTTGVEAALAGLPTFNPSWVPAWYPMAVSAAVSHACDAYAELLAGVRAAVDRRYAPPDDLARRVRSTVDDWFYRTDGDAHLRVAAAVADRLPARRVVHARSCARLLYGFRHARRRRARPGVWRRYALGLPPRWAPRCRGPLPDVAWAGSDKAFDAPAVRVLVADIHAARTRAGRPTRAVNAESARDRGDYLRPFPGRSVTMSCT